MTVSRCRLLCALLLSLIVAGAWAVPAQVQASTWVNKGSGSGTLAPTFASTPTNGNNEIGIFCFAAATTPITSVTQTGATWARLVKFENIGAQGVSIDIWVAYNISGAAKPCTTNTTAQEGAGEVIELSGTASSSMLDKTASNSGTATSAPSGTTATTSQANEYWLTVWGVKSANGTATIGTFTNSYAATTASNSQDALQFSAGAAEKVVSSTGTASSTATLSGDSGYAWESISITLGSAPVGGSAAAGLMLKGVGLQRPKQRRITERRASKAA